MCSRVAQSSACAGWQSRARECCIKSVLRHVFATVDQTACPPPANTCSSNFFLGSWYSELRPVVWDGRVPRSHCMQSGAALAETAPGEGLKSRTASRITATAASNKCMQAHRQVARKGLVTRTRAGTCPCFGVGIVRRTYIPSKPAPML